MLLTKLQSALGVVLIVGLLATGTTFLTCRMVAGQDNKTFAEGQDDEKRVARKPMEPAAEMVQEKQKEAFTAWGKEVDGLQAGLGFPPGQQRAFQYGETVTLVVRVRNVGKEEAKFQYLNQFFFENPPTVKDTDGKKVPQIPPEVGGLHTPKDVSLAPGKEIELSSLRYRLRPASEREIDSDSAFMPLYVGTGKATLQYERLFGNTSAGRIKVDPNLLNLATGKLELEIKPKETPWGEEVDGLQCQLRADKTVWKVGDLPAFKLVVRDQGKRDLMMHMAEDGCEVEFDGSWFRWQAPVSILGGLWAAGKRYDDFEIPVSLGERWGNASGKPINLSPGKHTVRVAYVTFDQKNPVRAVSNAVDIEITVPSKDDKKMQDQKGSRDKEAKADKEKRPAEPDWDGELAWDRFHELHPVEVHAFVQAWGEKATWHRFTQGAEQPKADW